MIDRLNLNLWKNPGARPSRSFRLFYVSALAAGIGVVAMAAVFGAASRSTFAFIIFAFEITQDYHAILPLMLVCVIADAVALLFMRNTIMTEKLARRGLRVPQEYEADALQQVTVGEMMAANTLNLPDDMREPGWLGRRRSGAETRP